MATEQQNRVRREFYRDRDGYDAIDKMVADLRVFGVDYSSELDTGETLDVTSAVWTIDPSSPIVGNASSSTITNSLTSHVVAVSSGEASQRYRFTSTVMTSEGRRLVREFRLYVID